MNILSRRSLKASGSVCETDRKGRLMRIRGIQFVVDAEGKKTAVLIDLKRHGELWEDLYDALISESRKDEPRVAWVDVKERLQQKRTGRA